MAKVFYDFETASEAPIRWGVDNYFAPARPLILTYAVEGGPVQLTDFTKQRRELPHVFTDPAATLIAHNNQFDRRVIERLFKVRIPMERFRCTQAQAYAHGLPGSLETLGEVLGIQKKKLLGDDGHKLMMFFCTPRTVTPGGVFLFNEAADHPEKWEAFKAYAIRDTEALREVYHKLPTHNFQGANLETWFLDQRINQRGFGFDTTLAAAASRVLDIAKTKQKRYTSMATEGAVGSVTQRQKLLEWFNNSGLEIAGLTKAEVNDALDSADLPPLHRFLLELRLEGSKSSGAKYRRGTECTGADGRLRDTMVYCGANRTGRWAGRTFQPQNLPRGTLELEEIEEAIEWILKEGADDE